MYKYINILVPKNIIFAVKFNLKNYCNTYLFIGGIRYLFLLKFNKLVKMINFLLIHLKYIIIIV